MNKYAKAVLPRVSRWKPLFKKELIKSIRWAEPFEWVELCNWCYSNFYELYPDVLNEVFTDCGTEKGTNKINTKEFFQFSENKEFA